MDMAIQRRARGCAVGAAVADALGMPLEFGPRRPADQLVREMRAGRIPPGTFTDDTEMALALAESLLAHRPLDPADLAQRFVGWYQAGPDDVGNHTRAVLSRIAAGQAWDQAVQAVQRQRPDSAGNGSVMRCWPMALAHWNDLDSLLAGHLPPAAGGRARGGGGAGERDGGGARAAAGGRRGRAAPPPRGTAEQRLGTPHAGERRVGAADHRLV